MQNKKIFWNTEKTSWCTQIEIALLLKRTIIIIKILQQKSAIFPCNNQLGNVIGKKQFIHNNNTNYHINYKIHMNKYKKECGRYKKSMKLYRRI